MQQHKYPHALLGQDIWQDWNGFWKMNIGNRISSNIFSLRLRDLMNENSKLNTLWRRNVYPNTHKFRDKLAIVLRIPLFFSISKYPQSCIWLPCSQHPSYSLHILMGCHKKQQPTHTLSHHIWHWGVLGKYPIKNRQTLRCQLFWLTANTKEQACFLCRCVCMDSCVWVVFGTYFIYIFLHFA